jgi:hypothetical protein
MEIGCFNQRYSRFPLFMGGWKGEVALRYVVIISIIALFWD